MRAQDMSKRGHALLKMMVGGIIIVADMGLTSGGCCSNSKCDAGYQRSISSSAVPGVRLCCAVFEGRHTLHDGPGRTR